MDTLGLIEDLGEDSHPELSKHLGFSRRDSNEGIPNLRAAVTEYEKTLIKKALIQARYNRKEASKILGIPLRSLSRKMKTHGLI